MKTIGLIGGMTWHSTVEYYRIINKTINEQLGGLHSAELLLHSIDFAEFKSRLDLRDWKEMANLLCNAAGQLQRSGAEVLLLGSVTPHLVADQIRESTCVPFLHIAEVLAVTMAPQQLTTVGLLGTTLTMEESFLTTPLSRAGVKTLVPEKDDRLFLHQSIFNELGKGVIRSETKERYLRIIDQLVRQGAEAIVLGCTELPMILKPEDVSIPLIDATFCHARAAAMFSLSN